MHLIGPREKRFAEELCFFDNGVLTFRVHAACSRCPAASRDVTRQSCSPTFPFGER